MSMQAYRLGTPACAPKGSQNQLNGFFLRHQ